MRHDRICLPDVAGQHYQSCQRPASQRSCRIHTSHLRTECKARAAISDSTASSRHHPMDLESRATPRPRSSHSATSPLISSSSRFLWTTALLVLLAISPVSAVRIPFQNCLPDSYRFNNPPPLQWTPLYADAVFDTHDESHNLLITVWANVSGSQNQGNLPPPSSPYWTNNNETNGKIIETDNPTATNPLATTLYRKVNVLTYEPWNDAVNFCDGGLINYTCPLAPVFDVNNNIDIPFGLPASNMSHDFFSSYAFTSFSATILVIEGDVAATNIGCFSATVTPDLGDLKWLLKFLPLMVLLLTGVAVPFASIFSPWGTADIFHWTSNYGRDADLLRLVTPGFGDCLQYIQFIALTGSLSLSYPGFFQPITSQVAWSSLMFNQSFVAQAKPWQSVVDGIYVTNGTYGMTRMGQLVGMARSEDIWAGMMVWLCVILAGVTLLVYAGLLGHWLFRRINKTPEEDLRAKNIPFSIGNIVRVVFGYFLLPIVALSCFQFVITGESPAYTVALAALTLVVVVVFAAWLLLLIVKTKPKSVLFDDLPTVLQYGPLYNTYSDEVAAFALIPMFLTFFRGLAIGAVQPSGVAQVVLLAICEVIQILTLHAFRPYSSPTSMNAYHTLFSSLRLITILLMVAFVPNLGVTDGPKGWIGYVILLLHGTVLVLGFFLNALQTIVEVIARLCGAGGDDARGLTRGGLTKIFGARQLSRRVNRENGPSRASQLSTSRMIDSETASKAGYVMPAGRVRSESAASMGGFVSQHRHRSSSALDSVDMYAGPHRHMDSASSYMPGTPGGDTSTFSFMSSPIAARQQQQPGPGLTLETADPYYRPPRRRRETLGESPHRESLRGSTVMEGVPHNLAPPPEPTEAAAEISRGPTPAPPGAAGQAANVNPANRPDYSTREVDFYYGVRGPALNSDGPGRKLGTGPADPTGPIATATGWFRTMLGGKSKEKGKGFEVVRSSRMPPAMMARDGGFGDETPPEGIPVAMGVLRNGPIDSDDDDEPQPKRSPKPKAQARSLLDESGDPNQSDPESPVEERHPRPYTDDPAAGEADAQPEVPRRSSKRDSAATGSAHAPSLSILESRSHSSVNVAAQGSQAGGAKASTLSPSAAALPFERTGSQKKRLSSNSSMDFPEDLAQIALYGADERPASIGTVPHHGINRVDPVGREDNFRGSAAELVDARSQSSDSRERK